METKPSMKLSELVKQYQNIGSDAEQIKQQRNVIFCIDQALHETHDKGYKVDSFDPEDIIIYPDDIKFNYTSKIEGNSDIAIKDNIYNNAMLALKIYLNYFDDMDSTFIRQKFDEFSFALPEEDVRYYKGVLCSNLKVYLGEFDKERRKRDIDKLKNMAFVPAASFGLLITAIGALTCLFAILYSIFT